MEDGDLVTSFARITMDRKRKAKRLETVGKYELVNYQSVEISANWEYKRDFMEKQPDVSRIYRFKKNTIIIRSIFEYKCHLLKVMGIYENINFCNPETISSFFHILFWRHINFNFNLVSQFRQKICMDLAEYLFLEGNSPSYSDFLNAYVKMDIEFIVWIKNKNPFIPFKMTLLMSSHSPFTRGGDKLRENIHPPLNISTLHAGSQAEYYSIDNQQRFIEQLLHIGIEWNEYFHLHSKIHYNYFYPFILMLERLNYPYLKYE